MNHSTGYRWLTELGDWLTKTVTVLFAITFLSLLGCGVWILYQYLSVGYGAHHGSVTSSFTTTAAGKPTATTTGPSGSGPTGPSEEFLRGSIGSQTLSSHAPFMDSTAEE